MSDINSGLLIIGVTNTVLFGAEQTVELILLNLSNGEDFSVPISPEQAEHIFAHMSEGEISSQESSGEDSGDQHGRLKELLETEDQEEGLSAWDETEKASQL